MTKVPGANWLSDDPLTSLEDLNDFSRYQFVDLALQTLQSLRRQSPSSTIGLIGAWGSGKSSILEGIEASIRGWTWVNPTRLKEQWSVANFNPWLYSSPSALHAGFFSELRAALPDEAQWKEVSKNVRELGEKLMPLTALTQLFGWNSHGVASQLMKSFEESEETLRAKVTAGLTGMRRPILIIVDDLDRLSAAELLQVFKLVRLVGRLPNVYYLLSYDERTLVDLLKKTDLIGQEDEKRALDYLEKIVQVRLDVPNLRLIDVENAVSQALDEMTGMLRVRCSTSDMQELRELFAGVLNQRLQTPRSLKRLFGQIYASVSTLGAEVNFSDFAALTWLRTFEPGIYRVLQTHQRRLLRLGGDELSSREGESSTDFWRRVVSESNVDVQYQQGVLHVLDWLFPRAGVRDAGPISGRHRPRRIDDPDYFSRHFSFGIPDGDIADSVILAGVSEMAQDLGFPRPALERMNSAFEVTPDLVASKLVELLRDANLEGKYLLVWLIDRYDFEPKLSNRVIRGKLETVGALSVLKMSEDEIFCLVSGLADIPNSTAFLGEVWYDLAHGGSYLDEEEIRMREAAYSLGLALDELFSQEFALFMRDHSSPLELTAGQSLQMVRWNEINPRGFRLALQDALSDSEWSDLEIVAWLMPPPKGANRTFPSLPLEELEGVLDLDESYRLVGGPRTDDLWTPEQSETDSLDGRVEDAISFLRRRHRHRERFLSEGPS